MENKQDIGKAFKDRLAGLHHEPGDAVWQNISASLQQQKRGGFRMPFWGKATSIALGVVLVLVFTHPYWEQYVPEVIIKMPGEKQETVSGKNNMQDNAAPGATSNMPATATQRTATTPRSQGGTGVAEGTNSSNIGYANGSTTQGSSTVNNTTGNTGTDVNKAVTYKNTGSKNSTVTHTTTGTKNYSVSGSKKSTRNVWGTKAGNTAAIPATSVATAPASGNTTGRKNTTKGPAGSPNPKDSKINTAITGNAMANTETPANTVASANTAVSGTGTSPGTDTTKNSTTVLGNSTNTSQGNTPTATATPATAPRGKVDKKLNGNMLYSTGNFPTITKAFVDTLLLEQKALDEKNGRERTFAKPAYALQDSLNGGNGHRSNFYVFAFIAPTNYKFGKTTSLIDPSLNRHQSSAETANNYGAYLGYEFSNQFSLRVGVSSVKLTNRTRNVTLGADYSGIDYTSGMSNTAANVALGNSPVTLRQETSFIEIPLEATYAMFGTRADLYFKGGVSMFFLGDNELYASNSQGSVLLGSLNRAQDFSLSGNAGFGFYYKFLNELQLNVEPGFKYYFNTFEDANPFSLYVQAGLLYRF